MPLCLTESRLRRRPRLASLATTIAATVAMLCPVASGWAQEQLPSLAEVRRALDEGRYGDAEAAARTLATADAAPSSLGGEAAGAGDLLVEALLGDGRGARPEVRSLAQSRVETWRGARNTSPHSLGISLRNLGDVWLESGDTDAAVATFREAIAVHDGAPARDDAEVAADLEGLGRALLEKGDPDGALAAAERALALTASADDPRARTIYGRSLQVRALVRQKRGDYASARAELERAVTLLEALHPSGHPHLAVALGQLGEQFALDGDPEGSRRILSRAVDMALVVLRPDHPTLASIWRNLANALSDDGDYTGAIRLGEQALRVAEGTYGPDHQLVAIQLNDLATALLLNGDYLAARRMFERAMAIYVKRQGERGIFATAALYNLALVSGKLGDLAEARRQFRRVIELWTAAKGANHPDVARAQWALAETLADLGQNREAIPVYRRAAALQERTLGPNHPFVAGVLSELSVSLARTGATTQALTTSQRALDIWRRASTKSGLPLSLARHAEILARTGDVSGAQQAYSEALELRRAGLGPSHPDVAATEVALSEIELRGGAPAVAVRRALTGERIAVAHLKLMLEALPERQALDYALVRPKGLDIALTVLPEAGSPSDAMDAVVRGRSVVLDELAFRGRSIVAASDPGVARLRDDLIASRQRLANLVIRGPGESSPASYAALIANAERRKERTEAALAEASAGYRSALARASIGLEEVRRGLPAGAALVSYVRYNRFSERGSRSAARPGTMGPFTSSPWYGAFILRKDATAPTFVRLSRAAVLDPLISAWRQALMPGQATVAGGARATDLGVQLRLVLWDPLKAALADADRVFVVPDGSLNLVPLAALPTTRRRYLIEDGPELHYLSAERDLVAETPTVGTATQGLLAIGGPNFVDRSSRLAMSNARRATPRPADPPTGARTRAGASSPLRGVAGLVSPEPTPLVDTQGCVTPQTMRFDPLPGSRVEAEGVTALWRQFNPAGDPTPGRLLTGSDATEQAFKTMGPGRRVLHIATHGFFLGDGCTSSVLGTRSVGSLAPITVGPAAVRRTGPDSKRPENPLLLSGLALAGANQRAAAGLDDDDGILTAEEVASMNLEGVEWAVLSACDTGLGTVAAGEGVFGLRRAFQIAGVRTVIMSLWSVEDRATRQWMETLYRARLQDHRDTAASVRQASLTVLRDRRAKGLNTSPFYWAGFVAAGDWR